MKPPKTLRAPAFIAPPQRALTTQQVPVPSSGSARKFALQTMRSAWRFNVPAAILMVIHECGEALVPTVMGLAIDHAVAPHDFGALIVWVCALAAVFAMLSLSFRFGSRMALLGVHVIQHQLRTRVVERILDPRVSAGPRRLPGEWLNIATSDVQRLSFMVTAGVYPVGQLAAVIFVGAVLLLICWPIGIAVLLGAPILLWLLDRVGRRLRENSEHQQELAARAAGTAEDLVSGLRVVKGIGAESVAAVRYRTGSRQALAAVLRSARSTGVYLGITQLVSTLFVIAIAAAAAWQAFHRNITIGQLITVVALAQFVMEPLGSLNSSFGRVWNAAVPSAGRILSVLISDSTTPAATGTPIPRSASLVLTEPALTIPDTGITTIVADDHLTRALVSGLSGHFDSSRPVPRLGGVPLDDFDPAELHRVVRVAPHVVDLFEGSVEDNIAAGATGDGSMRTDAITRAVFASATDDVVELLPHGLDTDVGEAGRMISGGQRQRVALARALATETQVLVLVDPTTAVDSVTEATIAQRMPIARAGRATIIFTHSPTLIAAADQVIMLDQMSVRYQGPPADAPALSETRTEEVSR